MSQSNKSSAGPGADHISALPDALLHHVLSFLEAREVVQTCVLARRWCDLWKTMPVLRVTDYQDVQKLRRFVDHLLLLRGSSNLNAFILESANRSMDRKDYVNLWIQYVLLRQVRMLSVAYSFLPSNLHLVSKYLRELHLYSVNLDAMAADFSSCVVLKGLEMNRCIVSTDKISSRSLERLNLYRCYFNPDSDKRICISAPSLISMQLNNFGGRTPFLEDMPLLVSAAVTLCSESDDCCENDNPGYCGYSCDYCYGSDDGSAGSVLLGGFSAAKHLELMAEPNMFILKRDLRWCPTFHNLKILMLNEWCVADDHGALICILQHSPVLKKLTLQLYGKEKPKSLVPSSAIFNSVDNLFASDNLARVEIKCCEVNQRVDSILVSLVTYGIHLEKIIIQQKNKSSKCFSFVCTGFS